MMTRTAKHVAWDKNMKKPQLGISLMTEPAFLEASFPLFAEGEIEILEWSFDTIQSIENEPIWLNDLLATYSNENKLIGHGVYYSLFDAHWGERQEIWINKIKKEVEKYKYNHISEHFGFMSSENYHKGVPLPIPLSDDTLNIGIDRLKRLQDAVNLPVGIENLAFSFSKKDVLEQGIFIEKMLDSVNGFLVLDLHNIYCQSHNFQIDMMQLIDFYPLDKVKEIHISGGSWQDSIYKEKQIRRDTHDGNVPAEIFSVLPTVLSKCVHTDFVIFERLGNTFYNSDDITEYQKDYRKIKKIMQQVAYQNNKKTWRKDYKMEKKPLINFQLQKEQQKLSNYLLTEDYDKIKNTKFKYWDVNSWDIEMVNTAIQISKKWN